MTSALTTSTPVATPVIQYILGRVAALNVWAPRPRPVHLAMRARSNVAFDHRAALAAGGTGYESGASTPAGPPWPRPSLPKGVSGGRDRGSDCLLPRHPEHHL
jgi:hypothetical protein